MSTYKFKVSKPEDIDIPRICRENADQDAFVVIFDYTIFYGYKYELGNLKRGAITSNKDYEGFWVAWEKDFLYSREQLKANITEFFKLVAEVRGELNRKKAEEEKRKQREANKSKILVTVIAKD